MMINNTLFKYLMAGGINTLIGYLIFVLFYNILATNAYVANILSYIVGLTSAYLLNHYFVFQVKKNSLGRILAFISCFIISFALNQMVLAIMLQYTHGNIAQIFAMTTYTIVFFLLNKYIVFNF